MTVKNRRTELMDRKQWLTLFVLCLALLIAIVDATVVNVTTPAIRAEFNVELNQVEWIVAVYALVFAAFIIVWGKRRSRGHASARDRAGTECSSLNERYHRREQVTTAGRLSSARRSV
jgi:MFS family permease